MVNVTSLFMQDNYTATLFVGAGASLRAGSIIQYGTLSVSGTVSGGMFNVYGALALGGGTVSCDGAFYITGTSITATVPGSVLSTPAGLYLNSGSVTVTGPTGGAPDLTISAGLIDDAIPIAVGTPALGPGYLALVGNMQVIPGRTVTVTGVAGTPSLLTFTPNTGGAFFELQGSTLTLSNGALTLFGGSWLAVDGPGAFLNALGAPATNTVTGLVRVKPGGTLMVADPAGSPTSLTMSGPLDDAGTAVLNPGAILSFGAAPAGSYIRVSGALNMYGATIQNKGEFGGVPVPVDLEHGTLTTNVGGFGGDNLSGDLVNNGTLTFAGPIHGLMVGVPFSGFGSYTQGSNGNLNMSIEDPASDPAGIGCDQILVEASATLGGSITVTAIGTLPPPPRPPWAIITTNFGITGDFLFKNLPPGVSAPPPGPGALVYDLT
jgi:hypothetical protein